jgi:ADP-ribose pyrophosphatase
VGDLLLEIPAGKLEAGEKPLECAKRELAEETGFEAEKWTKLLEFYPSPGFCDEMIYLFQAEKLKKTQLSVCDPDENIALLNYPLSEALELIKQGRIKDGKTIIALLNYTCQ